MPYKVTPTHLNGVLLIQPTVYSDSRGFFLESYNAGDFEKATGLHRDFVQCNHSRSAGGVLRGLHYQIHNPQGKLVRVVVGEVYDVAVDLRRSSPTFGQWFGAVLSAENKQQLWIPEGFAHGFYVLSDFAEFLYMATDYYYPQHERSIRWNDPSLGINWMLKREPLLSDKDMRGGSFLTAETYE